MTQVWALIEAHSDLCGAPNNDSLAGQRRNALKLCSEFMRLSTCQVEVGHQNEPIADWTSLCEVFAELASQAVHGDGATLRADVTVLKLEDGAAWSDQAVRFGGIVDRGRRVLSVDGPIRDENSLGNLGNDRVPEAFRKRPSDEDAAKAHEVRRPRVG